MYVESVRPCLAALGLAACTGWQAPSPEPERSPQASLALQMHLELPACGGEDAPTRGWSAWIGLDEVRWAAPGLRSSRAALALRGGALDQERPGLIGPFYDLVMQDVEAGSSVDLYADTRVPLTTVLAVHYTLSRAGAEGFFLACGAADAGRGLRVERSSWGPEPVREAKVEALAGDLALQWTDGALRAWALPRPSHFPPFDSAYWVRPARPGDAPVDVPGRVPLTLRAGEDRPLTSAEVRELASRLCARDGRPFGVRFEVEPTTSYAELVAAISAATPPPECRGPRQIRLEGGGTGERGEAVPLELALALSRDGEVRSEHAAGW